MIPTITVYMFLVLQRSSVVGFLRAASFYGRHMTGWCSQFVEEHPFWHFSLMGSCTLKQNIIEHLGRSEKLKSIQTHITIPYEQISHIFRQNLLIYAIATKFKSSLHSSQGWAVVWVAFVYSLWTLNGLSCWRVSATFGLKDQSIE